MSKNDLNKTLFDHCPKKLPHLNSGKTWRGMYKIICFLGAFCLCFGSIQCTESTYSDSVSDESSYFDESLTASVDEKHAGYAGYLLDNIHRQRERDRADHLQRQEESRQGRAQHFRERHRHAHQIRNRRRAKALTPMKVFEFLSKDCFYCNRKGNIILDGSLMRKVDTSEYVATCVSCHEVFKLDETFDHYNKTAHQFFYDVKKNKKLASE